MQNKTNDQKGGKIYIYIIKMTLIHWAVMPHIHISPNRHKSDVIQKQQALKLTKNKK